MSVVAGGGALALALVWALAAGADAEAPTRMAVDSVVAVIERRVLTMTELHAEVRLVLLERAGPDLAPRPIDDALRAAVLETMVARELLALEARRAGVVVREIEIDAALSLLRARLGDDAAAQTFFSGLGVDEELLRSRARRDLAADAIVRRALAQVAITDAERARALARHPIHGDLAPARAALERDARDRAMADLLARARTDVEVRVIAAVPSAEASASAEAEGASR